MHLLGLRSGEVAVPLTGATLFALVGFRKMSPLRIVFLVATVMICSVDGRGAMLAFILPVMFAALMLGKVRELVTVLVVGLVIFSRLTPSRRASPSTTSPSSSQERSISARQILENVASMVGQAGEQAEGTKEMAYRLVEHHSRKHGVRPAFLDRTRIRIESRRRRRLPGW